MCEKDRLRRPGRKYWLLKNTSDVIPGYEFGCLVDVGYVRKADDDDGDGGFSKEFIKHQNEITFNVSIPFVSRVSL